MRQRVSYNNVPFSVYVCCNDQVYLVLSDWFLWIWYWTLKFCKRQGISWIAEQLIAFQKGLCSKEVARFSHLWPSRLYSNFVIILCGSYVCDTFLKYFTSFCYCLGIVSTMLVHVLTTAYYRNKHLYVPSVFIILLLASWHPWNLCDFFWVKKF
jgi:hypothetical protein